MQSISDLKRSTLQQESGYFVPDHLYSILEFLKTQDLYAIQGISRQFKEVSEKILRARGYTYRALDNGPVSQISIFFDKRKQIAIEAKSNEYGKNILLPIKDKKLDLDGSDNTFILSDNPLDIRSITVSETAEKDMRVDFDHHHLLLKFSPIAESLIFQPTEQEVKLIDAINTNDTPRVAALLEEKVSPNTRDREGVPILVLAALYGDINNVKLLVTHGAYLEIRSKKGTGQLTPLLTAAHHLGNKSEAPPHEYSRKEVIRFLTERGAHINAQANTGKTILHYLARAARDVREEINFFLSKGVDPTQVNLHDKRPTDYDIKTFSFIENVTMLNAATIHITPVFYCSHWSCVEDGSAYSIHFKADVWNNRKFRVLDAFASKVKSVKTEDPIEGGLGLASEYVNFKFPDYDGKQVSDLPVPVCRNYAILTIECTEQSNCITLHLYDRYKCNEFVRNAIEKMLLELGLGSSIELTTALTPLPDLKLSASSTSSVSATASGSDSVTDPKKDMQHDSIYASQLTQFKPVSASAVFVDKPVVGKSCVLL